MRFNHDLNIKKEQWLSVIVGKDFLEIQIAVEKNGELMDLMEKVDEIIADRTKSFRIKKEEEERKNLTDDMYIVYKSGKEKGREEGKEQNQIEVIKNAADMRMKLEDIAKLVRMSDDEVQEILEGIEKDADDRRNVADALSYAYNSGKEEGRTEGRKEGRTEGRTEGFRIRMVKNGAKMKMELKDIAKIVGVSIEEVEKILKEND